MQSTKNAAKNSAKNSANWRAAKRRAAKRRAAKQRAAKRRAAKQRAVKRRVTERHVAKQRVDEQHESDAIAVFGEFWQNISDQPLDEITMREPGFELSEIKVSLKRLRAISEDREQMHQNLIQSGNLFSCAIEKLFSVSRSLYPIVEEMDNQKKKGGEHTFRKELSCEITKLRTSVLNMHTKIVDYLPSEGTVKELEEFKKFRLLPREYNYKGIL